MREVCAPAGAGLAKLRGLLGAGAPADNDPAARHAPSLAHAIRSRETHVSLSETAASWLTRCEGGGSLSGTALLTRGSGPLAPPLAPWPRDFVARPWALVAEARVLGWLANVAPD